MTCHPAATQKKLGLVIDLDTCVGCQACVTSCKEWNTGGHMAPLTDIDPYGADADGVWFNRVHTYEHSRADGGSRGAQRRSQSEAGVSSWPPAGAGGAPVTGSSMPASSA